jgi:hypothetical protein
MMKPVFFIIILNNILLSQTLTQQYEDKTFTHCFIPEFIRFG